jgi:hypothetical protein
VHLSEAWRNELNDSLNLTTDWRAPVSRYTVDNATGHSIVKK